MSNVPRSTSKSCSKKTKLASVGVALPLSHRYTAVWLTFIAFATARCVRFILVRCVRNSSEKGDIGWFLSVG